jgi:nicotinic acid mononucleotide adenylyltransferase
MSGGYFDYQQYRLSEMVDEIKQLISNNDGPYEVNDWGDKRGSGYTAETIAEFRNAIEHLQKAAAYVHRIDYLVSGDDGEETFHRRLRHDLLDQQRAVP